MQKFNFYIGQEFIRLLSVKNIGPVYIQVEYEVIDDKVVLVDISLPPSLLPFLSNLQGLHDSIYSAAENNALNNELVKQDAKLDIFKELGKYFNQAL